MLLLELLRGIFYLFTSFASKLPTFFIFSGCTLLYYNCCTNTYHRLQINIFHKLPKINKFFITYIIREIVAPYRFKALTQT